MIKEYIKKYNLQIIDKPFIIKDNKTYFIREYYMNIEDFYNNYKNDDIFIYDFNINSVKAIIFEK